LKTVGSSASITVDSARVPHNLQSAPPSHSQHHLLTVNITLLPATSGCNPPESCRCLARSVLVHAVRSQVWFALDHGERPDALDPLITCCSDGASGAHRGRCAAICLEGGWLHERPPGCVRRRCGTCGRAILTDPRAHAHCLPCLLHLCNPPTHTHTGLCTSYSLHDAERSHVEQVQGAPLGARVSRPCPMRPVFAMTCAAAA